jgi:hypothetical protein
LHCHPEAQNTFAGHVPPEIYKTYLEEYDNEEVGASDGIIPDLKIDDFPAVEEPRMLTKDLDMGMHRRKPAIVEIKGVRVGVTYKRSDNKRGTDIRAEQILKEYLNKVRTVDRRCAPGSSREPDEANSLERLVGPFERAYRNFAGKQVIPLVVGGYGETNTRQFDKFLQFLARLTLKRGKGIAKLVPCDASKSQGYSFIISQFRRVLGITFTRANCALKLQRLPCTGRSIPSAKQKARRCGSLRRFHRRDLPQWFQFHSSDFEAITAWHAFCSHSRAFPYSRGVTRRGVGSA